MKNVLIKLEVYEVRRPSCSVGLLLVAVLNLTLAGYVEGLTNQTSVAASSGGVVTNAAMKSYLVVGQGTSVGLAANSNFINYSGFLNTFIMRPDLDADSDGIPDENDPDNDNDGLQDESELTGTAFSPNTPTGVLQGDSDGDGMRDGAEAQAGTDPTSTNSVFVLDSVRAENGAMFFTWKGRAGLTYDLIRGDTVQSLSSNPVIVTSITASNGIGIWQSSDVEGVDTGAASRAYYRIRLR